jgi:hypothetical protein
MPARRGRSMVEESVQGQGEGLDVKGGTYTVFKKDKSSFTVTGSTVTCEVKDGSLVIMLGPNVYKILSPGQRLSVNEPPA